MARAVCRQGSVLLHRGFGRSGVARSALRHARRVRGEACRRGQADYRAAGSSGATVPRPARGGGIPGARRSQCGAARRGERREARGVMAKHITIIGAGVAGIATASFLRRDGHDVTVVDMRLPAEYCSSGNAGILSPGSCVPFGMPGNLKNVPRWLLDPLGPLAIRPGYVLRALPWLLRFQAASRMARIDPIADALRALLKQTLDAWGPLAQWAGVPDIIRRTGYLVVYESEQAFRGDALAWKIRRDRGVVCTDLDAARIRELEPALRGIYAR